MEAKEIEALYAQAQAYDNLALRAGEASPRERFFRIMDYQKFDRIIDTEFGYWDNTLTRWHREGLPEYVDTNEKADLYFGFDQWQKRIPANVSLLPPFEVEILEDDGRHQIVYDESRVKCRVFSDGTDTIPHYLEFPIKDRASYLPFKERLEIRLHERLGIDLAAMAEKINQRNYVLVAYAGSTAGIIRNWMGFERICLSIYDQPELLAEILEDLSKVSRAVAQEITRYVQVDLVAWWEDIAFKNGPIVTPSWFIEHCGGAMNKVMSVYQARGTRFGYVDCDGDLRRLVPGWLNNGVNIMFPLEVASGVHPETLRQDHPGIRMMGGVDKLVLTAGRAEIKRELLRLKPLVEEGGFIPHVDHRVQADVPYANYLYYLEAKRDIFGLPNTVQDGGKGT